MADAPGGGGVSEFQMTGRCEVRGDAKKKSFGLEARPRNIP